MDDESEWLRYDFADGPHAGQLAWAVLISSIPEGVSDGGPPPVLDKTWLVDENGPVQYTSIYMLFEGAYRQIRLVRTVTTVTHDVIVQRTEADLRAELAASS